MRFYSLLGRHKEILPVGCGLFALMLLLFSTVNSPAADSAKNSISAVSSVQMGDTLNITIKGTTPPTYTVYELFKPARIVVDIAEATLAPHATITLPEKTGITLTTSNITDTTPPLTRFTFTLKESRPFSVVQKENNIAIAVKTEKHPAQSAAPVKNKEGAASEISDIKVLTTPSETRVQLLANGKVPSYSYDVLDQKGNAPARLYIDVNNVTGDTLIKEQKVGTALAGIRVAKRGTGLRFVLDSAKDTLFPFQINSMKNGIEIRIRETAKPDELSRLIQRKETIESQLPKVDPLQLKDEAVNAKSVADSMKDAFNFSGYNKERITVDFYKIDLHNVFRLLREVSKTNIVVDEAVSGSLTLALNDVPWDFALDIILNLKDLQKEERFNTIVILPKNKTFVWPQRAEDNLSFETDDAVTEQEAILIQQQMHIPKTVVEAKKFISRAQRFEKQEEFETAVRQYELGLEKWPDNAKLANKISSLYLVQLRQNAKALFFAEKALTIDPNLAGASLNAAIASANMEENKKAQQYFDQAVLGKKPLKETLLSYAVFSEEQQRYTAALKLLKKYNTLYGENLDSMIATARILDKNGKHADAGAEYKKILLSGYRLAPDLKKYIQGRIALSQPM